jgi:cell division septal protein FtsQ
MSRWLRGRNVRRDYSRKSFSNPLFEPSRTGRDGRKRWRARIILIVGLAAIGGWTWFVAFSPAFRITDIQVRGTDRIPSWEVQDAVAELLKERRWLLLPKTSVLVISEENIVDTLNERFVLESLDVTKRPPHTLLIELRERVSAVLLQLPDGSQGLIDLGGAVTRLYKAEEAIDVIPKLGPSLDEQQGRSRAQYPVLYDDKNEKLELRDQAVRAETVQTVIELPKLFDARFGRAPYITETHIDGMTSQTLRVVTSEGWAIYLDASGNVSEQLGNAQTILKNKVGGDRPNLDYIDVRFGDKIFFKLKS